MLTTEEALEKGYIKEPPLGEKLEPDFKKFASPPHGFDWDKPEWHFDFEDGGNKYELRFEPLLFDNQYYVALYKNKELMTEKVVVKPGYIKNET